MRSFMRHFFISALAILFFSGSAYASKGVTKVDDSRYTLSVGQLTMTVDANQGGKIVSFKYGDTEIISQMTMPNSFGSTFWTSPQKDWSWPPVPQYDAMPYSVKARKSTLTVTSEIAPKLQYRISKAYSIDRKKGCIRVKYSIKNESDVEKQVAPWEITRVLNSGIFFTDADAQDISTAGRLPVPFIQASGASWYQFDAIKDQRKSNVDGKGWYAFADKGLLLIKQFPDIAASQPAPNEAEVQVYVHNGKTYAELEAQGVYTKIKPGESIDWEVDWYLVPCDLPCEPSEALFNKVIQTIKH